MPRPRKVKLHREGYREGHHVSPGEGSIVPVKGGTRWRGAFTWQDPLTGTSRRIWVTGVDEADVRRRWDLRRAKLAPLAPDTPASALTLDGYLATWLTDVVRVKRRTRTYETYLRQCAQVPPYLGAVTLAALTGPQIQRWYGELVARELSPATIWLAHVTLHSALNHAVRTGLLERNPATGLTLPRRRRHEAPTLSAAELRAILAYSTASEHRLSALWTLIATTGLRRSEALGVRWRDLDLDAALLMVRQQLVSTQTRGLEVGEPKSDRGRRPLHLMSRTVEALRDHRQRMAAEGLDTDLVFVTTKGKGFYGTTIDAIWRRLLQRAGLPHIHLHALRHTVATLLMLQGEAPRLVQEVLGHQQISITQEIYSHVLPSMHRGAMDRLEGVLWPESTVSVAPDVAQSG